MSRYRGGLAAGEVHCRGALKQGIKPLTTQGAEFSFTKWKHWLCLILCLTFIFISTTFQLLLLFLALPEKVISFFYINLTKKQAWTTGMNEIFCVTSVSQWDDTRRGCEGIVWLLFCLCCVCVASGLSPCHLTLNATSPSFCLSIMLSQSLTGRIRAGRRTALCTYGGKLSLCCLHPWPTFSSAQGLRRMGGFQVMCGSVCRCATPALSFMLGWFQTACGLPLSSPERNATQSHAVTFNVLISEVRR